MDPSDVSQQEFIGSKKKKNQDSATYCGYHGVSPRARNRGKKERVERNREKRLVGGLIDGMRPWVSFRHH